jgi:hypothetical protein
MTRRAESAARASAIARKCMRELMREPMLIVFALAISPFFLFLDYIGYSREARPLSRTVLFADPAAERALAPALRSARFADGRPSLKIKSAQPGAAMEWVDAELRGRRADIAFVPADEGSRSKGFVFTTRGDAASAGYLAAASIIDSALDAASADAASSGGNLRIEVVDAKIAGPRSDFDQMVPGQVAFCALMMTPLAAFLAGREIRKKGMTRLKASPLRPFEYQAGIQASLMLFCLAAGALTLGIALAMGFSGLASAAGAIGPLLASILTLSACALPSIAIGLALAPLCSSDSAALNAGFSVTMLQIFLSGAFFSMPSPSWLELWGMDIGPLDLLPGTHAVMALGQILIGGAGVGDILPRLGLLAALSALYASAASCAFARRAFAARA